MRLKTFSVLIHSFLIQIRSNKDISPIVYRSNDVDGTAHYYCSYLAVWFHYASPLLVLYFPKGQMPLLTPLVTCWVMSRELKSFLLKLLEMGQIISHLLTQLWVISQAETIIISLFSLGKTEHFTKWQLYWFQKSSDGLNWTCLVSAALKKSSVELKILFVLGS